MPTVLIIEICFPKWDSHSRFRESLKGLRFAGRIGHSSPKATTNHRQSGRTFSSDIWIIKSEAYLSCRIGWDKKVALEILLWVHLRSPSSLLPDRRVFLWSWAKTRQEWWKLNENQLKYLAFKADFSLLMECFKKDLSSKMWKHLRSTFVDHLEKHSVAFAQMRGLKAALLFRRKVLA